jgi:hypothetical protein
MARLVYIAENAVAERISLLEAPPRPGPYTNIFGEISKMSLEHMDQSLFYRHPAVHTIRHGHDRSRRETFNWMSSFGQVNPSDRSRTLSLQLVQ